MEMWLQLALGVVCIAVFAAYLGLVAEAAAQKRWGWAVAMVLFPLAVLPYAFGWRAKTVRPA